jgi:YHS domain-containing protein
MRFYRTLTVSLSFFLLTAAVWAGQQDQPAPAGTHRAAGQKVVKQSFCPPCEMKLDPNPSLYVDVEGYRIYVCSSYCGEKIKKNPAVYIKKIQDAGETPEALPGKPVSLTDHSCGK